MQFTRTNINKTFRNGVVNASNVAVTNVGGGSSSLSGNFYLLLIMVMVHIRWICLKYYLLAALLVRVRLQLMVRLMAVAVLQQVG